MQVPTGARNDPPPHRYRIRIRGRLGETMRSAFPAFQARASGGDTVLTGALRGSSPRPLASCRADSSCLSSPAQVRLPGQPARLPRHRPPASGQSHHSCDARSHRQKAAWPHREAVQRALRYRS